MRYTSTRDNNSSVSCSFEEALCSGYAPDGGLFVPEELPKIDIATLQEWSTLTVSELAFDVLRRFISVHEISNSALQQICNESYPDDIPVSNMIPKAKNEKEEKSLFFLAELYHGPTFCFKDLGLRPVIAMLSHFAKQKQNNNKKIHLLVATTGDTGPAAVHAVQTVNDPSISIVVHYPEGQISTFQRKQLTTVQSPQVQIVTFQGGGDDMDGPIRNILKTHGLRIQSSKDDNNFLVCGVNSYNIGRPLMQTIHFIWTYLRVIQQTPNLPLGSAVDIIVPTGAMGNLVSGYMVKQMGIPIRTLGASVNINDITYRTVTTGKFYKSPFMERTLSEAINIQYPYNFERILYYLTNENATLVKKWMDTYHNQPTSSQNQKLDIPSEWLSKLQTDFQTARITDEELCETIRMMQSCYDIVIDPHTAVAIAGAQHMGYISVVDHDSDGSSNSSSSSTKSPFAVLATASPCKFQNAVTAALGTNGWEAYVGSDEYPSRAKDFLTKEEVDPILYAKHDDSSLKVVQKNWEAQTRQLLLLQSSKKS